MKSMVWLALVLASGAWLAAAPARAADPAPARETPARKEARLRWWREGRFGLFIHWGPVSLKGTEISWSRANVNPKCPNKGEIPAAVYDNLYKDFNPVQFDAGAWAAVAREAGTRYVVLTAKHCDGFLLWHSQTDPYNISASPFRRDVCAELSAAVRKQGLKVGWYFSPMDWRDPDFRTDRNAAFLARMQGELKEVLSNYGPIDLLWFDWDGREPLYDQAATYKLVKSLQPGMVINNRLDLGVGGSDRQILSPHADYYTPEQQLGAYDDARPWETCLTLGTQWAWKPNDTIKSTPEVIRTLAYCAGGDGNLLLNVGPMPDGKIEPRQADVLKGVGAWLKAHGDSIYGTRGGPYKSNRALASTRRGDTVYLHLLRPAAEVKLPPLPRRVTAAAVLGGEPVPVQQTADGLTLRVPAGAGPKEGHAVVKMTLDGSAMNLPAIPTAAPSALPKGTRVTASNTYRGDPEHGPDRAFDDDPHTRWAADAGVKQAWLMVEYPQPVEVSSLAVSEEYGRVRAFELQAREGSGWKTVLKGTTLGRDFRKEFPPVTAPAFRLNVTEAADGPTFWEVRLK